MNSLRAGLCCALLAGIGGAALAADVKGSQDDPLLGRFEGPEIRIYKQLEFDEFPYLVGPQLSAAHGTAGFHHRIRARYRQG